MFKYWININEAISGRLFASICEAITILEGRKDPEKLRKRASQVASPTLFGDFRKNEKQYQIPQKSCQITPLSGYKSHIEQIQKFAHANPDNFAQVMMFSPLSANCSFSKHWDNFQVLMMILKHYFPQKVEEDKLKKVLDGFCDYLHALKHTISGWKINTICYIWNNREELYNELHKLAKEGDDVKLISRLSQIPGVQSVKAGFITQLLFGRAGCIDTHNIDIYSKVFPELAPDLNPSNWSDNETGPSNYINLLGKLQNRGIGSQQLWDVWVDFVENFYKTTSPHGLGTYTDMGSALDPNDPVYAALQNVKIPKDRAGRSKDSRQVDIPVASGLHGMGASATHLQTHPDELLNQFHKMYRLGQPGSDAARAIPFHLTKKGLPLDPLSGMGMEPSLLKHFGHCLDQSGHVDPNCVRKTIDQKIGNVERKHRSELSQGQLWPTT